MFICKVHHVQVFQKFTEIIKSYSNPSFLHFQLCKSPHVAFFFLFTLTPLGLSFFFLPHSSPLFLYFQYICFSLIFCLLIFNDFFHLSFSLFCSLSRSRSRSPGRKDRRGNSSERRREEKEREHYHPSNSSNLPRGLSRSR